VLGQHIAHRFARQILRGVIGDRIAQDARQRQVVLHVARENESQHLGSQENCVGLSGHGGNNESRQMVLSDHARRIEGVRIHGHDGELLVEILCSHRATIG
jgi:hypothetical protein